MIDNREKFKTAVLDKFGDGVPVNRTQIQEIVDELQIPYPHWFTAEEFRVGHGEYMFKVAPPAAHADVVEPVTNPYLNSEYTPRVPNKFPGYVKFGFFKDLKTILSSNMFYPVFITGLSGNGKTLMVEEVCAELNRTCIRVNISVETDQTDLIGGLSLVNGNTEFKEGPVLIAMKSGSVLLIDEIDRGSSKLMCIQGILEGKPYYNKSTGETVFPAKGFTVVATANTKGRGSEDGRFLSSILDDAFLERFPVTLEQEYANKKTEMRILQNELANYGKEDNVFCECLVRWAETLRDSYIKGSIEEQISTRRLVHIIKAYGIFGDKIKAIQYCINRFDDLVKKTMMESYKMIDASLVKGSSSTEKSPINNGNSRSNAEDAPF